MQAEEGRQSRRAKALLSSYVRWRIPPRPHSRSRHPLLSQKRVTLLVGGMPLCRGHAFSSAPPLPPSMTKSALLHLPFPRDWMRGHDPICDNMLISARARPSPDAAYPNSTKEETDSEGSRDLSVVTPQGKPGLQARAVSMCSCNTVSWAGHGSVVGNPKVPPGAMASNHMSQPQ